MQPGGAAEAVQLKAAVRALHREFPHAPSRLAEIAGLGYRFI